MKNSRDLLKDKESLDKVLGNVSKQHIDMCERYGCEGLWNNSSLKSSKNEENKNFIFVDFKNRKK